MKIKNKYEYPFPSYALAALICGDYSGLENEDIKLLDNFIKANSHIDRWEDKEIDQEPYFTPYPEFGLACNVVDLVGIEFEK